MRILLALALLHSICIQTTFAAKRFPAPGIAVPEETRSALSGKLGELQSELSSLVKASLTDLQRQHLPDAQVYEKAVRYALDHNEFYRTNEFKIAGQLLDEGLKRVRAITSGSSFLWADGAGLVVRAYRSRIDGSVQPYGLVVPASYQPGSGKQYRLDVWLHGRDEGLTELKFIHDRSTRPGEFTPPDTFVLHPYGRYCNAFKFAGEVDVLEALEKVMLQYPIDKSRVALRGFSMGGAGVWHLAAHHADRWFMAAPGAGFAESEQYLRVKPGSVPAWEKKLWQWYDATDYALNLFNCPTVAYSGELDKQRQAADVMAGALAREGLPLIHLIGPKTAHKYEPETKRLLSSIADTFALSGRPELPRELRFTTRTLRYPKMEWLTLLGLEKHWERADAHARLDKDRVLLSLTNVTSFRLDFRRHREIWISEVVINGARVSVSGAEVNNHLIFTRTNNSWALGAWPDSMRKSPGHQGPIDDAFMDAFVFVSPSARGFHEKTSAFVQKELDRAVFEWRAQFRGEVQLVKDADLRDEQIRTSNLILWGDPQSNEVIHKILSKLPLKWTAERLELGARSVDARTHLPLLIFPNPLNPEKYIVLNSGFTFRGFGSNAGQTPKLPDYAFVDTTRADPFSEIAMAGFFNEQWQFDPSLISER